jgi:hypothetical protein
VQQSFIDVTIYSAAAPIIVAFLGGFGLEIPLLLLFGVITTFVPLSLFSLWLIFQGGKSSKIEVSEPDIQ